MNKSRSVPTLAPVLTLMMILAALLFQPAPAEAQCGYTMVDYTYMVGGYDVVKKYVTVSCMGPPTATMATPDLCAPAVATVTRMTLTASAMTMLPSPPSCRWACPCGTVTIDSSDGLPVELMEFEVDDDESSASAEDEDDSDTSD